jgi:hypothetical protein
MQYTNQMHPFLLPLTLFPIPLQLSKTPQIDMQLRHPKRNMTQTIKRLSSETHIPEIVFYAGEIDPQVREAFDGGEVQDGVEEGRDVAGEVGDGFGGDPGEDVLEVVVLAGEEVAVDLLALILDFLPKKKVVWISDFRGLTIPYLPTWQW